MIQTTQCIVCLVKATIFSGHVHRDGEKIIAGWCKQHSSSKRSARDKECPGCYGDWKVQMGYTDYKFPLYVNEKNVIFKIKDWLKIFANDNRKRHN